MRLTGDFILRARVCINPLRERELDLRGIYALSVMRLISNDVGYKIPAVENLGATKVCKIFGHEDYRLTIFCRTDSIAWICLTMRLKS